MLIKTRGIVLRAIKYSETSVIMDVFTEEKGLRSYIVSGVRSRKPQVAASLLQPMNLLDMVVYHRDDKSMCRTKELSSEYLYKSIPFNLSKGAVGTFIIELLQKTLREPGEQEELFDFLHGFFLFVDKSTAPAKNIHLWFMLQYSAYLGFMPGERYSEATPIFDLQEGVFVETAESTHSLQPHFAALLDELLHCDISECHEVKMSKEDRKFLLRELVKYYKLHVEGLTALNALSVLEVVFG
ncbi:MAG: DNA repair protein RecO (recombination protein O) [Polaribacter sp.]|jgi:DNA repair protein RecO (recombination protein O)